MYDRTLQFDIETATSSITEAKAAVAYLDEQLELGSGKAGYWLSILTGEGLVIGDDQVRAHLRSLNRNEVEILEITFPKLHDEAFLGDGVAMHYLAQYYQSGLPPLGRACMAMFAYWVNRAHRAGYVLAQY